MEPIHYIVLRIDGDYAQLVTADEPLATPFPVALALLPDGVGEGDHLVWENLEYTILP